MQRGIYMRDNDFILDTFLSTQQSILKINTITGKFRFLKHDEDVDLNQEIDLYSYVKSYISSGVVIADDLSKFEAILDMDLFREQCKRKETGEVVTYRRIKEDKIVWARVLLFIPDSYSEENPYVMITRRYLTMDESGDQNIKEQIENKAFKIIKSNTNSKFQKKIQYSNIYDNLDFEYWVNLLSAMSYFLRRYLDFYLIDLENDRYAEFKMNKGILEKRVPIVGQYSQMARYYINSLSDESVINIQKKYDSTEKIKKLLKNKLSTEYTYVHTDGKMVKTILTKIESDNDIPTKVICRTLYFDENIKLKIKTFGNFDVFDADGQLINFQKKKAKQVFAYLVDKHGYAVSTREIVMEVLEKQEDDKNAIKYVSTLINSAIKDIQKAGFSNVIIKEWNSYRVNEDEIDCDYFHLLDGDTSYLNLYHNEYMKAYSWAEATNGEIMSFGL